MPATVSSYRVAAAAAVIALGLGWMLGECGQPDPATDPLAAETSAPPRSAPATGPPDPETSTPAGGSGGPEPGPQPAGPQVELFRVAQEPRCPGGTEVNPIVGQPVVLAWRVAGTDSGEVTLSIDGHGVYGTYPAEGGVTLEFPCTGSEGDTQRHTYLLTATGTGRTATAELVVAATVHERTDL